MRLLQRDHLVASLSRARSPPCLAARAPARRSPPNIAQFSCSFALPFKPRTLSIPPVFAQPDVLRPASRVPNRFFGDFHHDIIGVHFPYRRLKRFQALQAGTGRMSEFSPSPWWAAASDLRHAGAYPLAPCGKRTWVETSGRVTASVPELAATALVSRLWSRSARCSSVYSRPASGLYFFIGE